MTDMQPESGQSRSNAPALRRMLPVFLAWLVWLPVAWFLGQAGISWLVRVVPFPVPALVPHALDILVLALVGFAGVGVLKALRLTVSGPAPAAVAAVVWALIAGVYVVSMNGTDGLMWGLGALIIIADILMLTLGVWLGMKWLPKKADSPSPQPG